MDTDLVPSSPSHGETSSPSAMLTLVDMEEARVDVPGPNDVLSGRGGSINSHQGNEQFRELVEKRKRVYLTARFKREKRLIASSIVSEIRNMNPSGRFLARHGNKDTGFWYDIGDEKARDKTSQALRENAPSIRAEIETEINEQRAELKRKETVPHEPKAPPPYIPAVPPHSYYPPPPATHHQSQQSHWDWYHQFYGYPPPAHAQMSPHYPPPHHHHHHAPPAAVAAMPGAHPQHLHPHPAAGYWGEAVVPTGGLHAEKTGEEFKDDSMHDMTSQEENDHRLAMDLQQEEKAALYEARKTRYKDSLARRSNACLSFGSNSRPQPQAARPRVSHVRRQPPAFASMEADSMTQEQQDHCLAVALQDREDNALRNHLDASGESSRKTSRSNAYSQVARVNRDSVYSDNSAYGALEQMVPASFAAWVTSDSSAKPKATTQRRRSVQFKDDNLSMSNISHGTATFQRQSSTGSADRPLLAHAQQNTSLLSQVANHIMGSWENSISSKPSSLRDNFHRLHDPHDVMETEGLEVQLRDPHDETSMPPPSPRVQIDWHEKTGSNANSWIPESLNATWASAPNSNYSMLGGAGHIGVGISPVHSLEMDGSANNISVGGGSLCHLFDQDESLQRALREVPSWERSMRSKSPLSIGSMEDSDISLIRVRDMKPFRSAPQNHNKNSGSGDMDWENHPEQSL